MRTATFDSEYEIKFREVEDIMRKNGISIFDNHIHFDDGSLFVLADIDLCSGFNPSIESIPRENKDSVLVLQE